jgi:hypothetical protein
MGKGAHMLTRWLLVFCFGLFQINWNLTALAQDGAPPRSDVATDEVVKPQAPAVVQNGKKKYINNGCAQRLEQYSIWLATTHNLLRNHQIGCSPMIESSSSDNPPKVTVTLSSTEKDNKNKLVFEFDGAGGKYHPCDDTNPYEFAINKEIYHTGAMNSLSKKSDEKPNPF